MKVYVIRHGESVNNLEYKWTGHLDVNLTPKGYLDAKKAGEIIKNVNFNKVFSSDLKRAVETAKTALTNYEVETTPLLREINVGNLAGNPIDIISIEERRNAGVVGYAKWNGETKEEMRDRVFKFLKTLESLNLDTVAVFTHAGFLRTALDVVLKNCPAYGTVQCGNCCVGIFEFKNGNWSLNSWINL